MSRREETGILVVRLPNSSCFPMLHKQNERKAEARFQPGQGRLKSDNVCFSSYIHQNLAFVLIGLMLFNLLPLNPKPQKPSTTAQAGRIECPRLRRILPSLRSLTLF